jgi:hypothetical protein
MSTYVHVQVMAACPRHPGPGLGPNSCMTIRLGFEAAYPSNLPVLTVPIDLKLQLRSHLQNLR